MKLARLERELSKPKNWGEITYNNIKNRNSQINELNGLPPPPKNTVREAMEHHPTVSGPLNASDVLENLNEVDQCDFFSRYSKCRILIIRNWVYISEAVLRSISITFSEFLIELDLSYSAVNNVHLEILLVRSKNLNVLKLRQCNEIDYLACKVIVQLISTTLTELYINNCPNIRSETLQILGGTAALSTRGVRKLKFLDLGHCPVIDKGLSSIALGCKNLIFLNLFDCSELTDSSVCDLAQSCKKMQLLNLSGCYNITSKSCISIGRNMKDLVSLNLSRCPKISDKGIIAIANGCPHIQAINLAGLKKISEDSMYSLANNCKGLLTLNLTGCERITIHGLDALVQGLDYVEKGVSFMGFKPIDNHIDKKLNDHLQMIQESVEKKAREDKAIREKRLKKEQEELEIRINNAASLIQNYLYRYKLRMYYYQLWRQRVKKESATLIQRVYRGMNGRIKAQNRYQEREEFFAKSPFALKIQRVVRAYLVRVKNPHVSKAIRELYQTRRSEARSALAVRLQAQIRKYIASLVVKSTRELRKRRLADMNSAILVMQLCARRYNAIRRVNKMRIAKQNYEAAKLSASIKIYNFCSEGIVKYKSKLTGEQAKRYFREKWTSAITIQKFYRGFFDREIVRKMKIQLALKNFAAREIQRIYRGSRVLHWKDMRMNVIAAYVLDRHYVERREHIDIARMRYREFVIENRRDSASDPDDEEEAEWVKIFDSQRKVYFWQNFATNEITYDEPFDPIAHEKGLIGKRVQIFWIVQNAWYPGTITRYHKRKMRHRVEYDDGDHEWINFQEENDRVQIQEENGIWTMFLLYNSKEQLYEFQKLEERRTKSDYQSKAFSDAMQWKQFIDDKNNEIMFISQVTGEIRTGAPNASDWVIQDDGIGYPCFYNLETGVTVYEDPRFIYEVDSDIASQRKFVLQELRYALYFCQDFWDQYTKAMEVNDQRQIRKTMLTIRNSPKPIHLSSLIIRAKALYRQVSVVDRPMDQQIIEELEYASWISERLAEIMDQTEEEIRKTKDSKRKLLDKLTENSGKVVYCRYCSRETKKHLDFCPHCGKPQVFL